MQRLWYSGAFYTLCPGRSLGIPGAPLSWISSLGCPSYLYRKLEAEKFSNSMPRHPSGHLMATQYILPWCWCWPLQDLKVVQPHLLCLAPPVLPPALQSLIRKLRPLCTPQISPLSKITDFSQQKAIKYIPSYVSCSWLLPISIFSWLVGQTAQPDIKHADRSTQIYRTKAKGPYSSSLRSHPLSEGKKEKKEK